MYLFKLFSIMLLLMQKIRIRVMAVNIDRSKYTSSTIKGAFTLDACNVHRLLIMKNDMLRSTGFTVDTCCIGC